MGAQKTAKLRSPVDPQPPVAPRSPQTTAPCTAPPSLTFPHWMRQPARSGCPAPRAFPTGCCCLPPSTTSPPPPTNHSPPTTLPALDAAAGEVRLPGSKSISNRVLLLAALSNGTTTVHQLLASDDTRVMLDALRQIGCAVDEAGSSVHITGLGGRAPRAPAKLFLGNAGTAMRPLTAALALLGGEFELSGVARMHQRPIGDLVDALRQLGCRIDYLGNDGYPPLRPTHAPCAPAQNFPALPPGAPPLALAEPIRVRADVSSQFLTALLMALPLAAGRQSIVIEVLGELISKPYIAIPLELLARFGIVVERQGWQRFTIAAGSRY